MIQIQKPNTDALIPIFASGLILPQPIRFDNAYPEKPAIMVTAVLKQEIKNVIIVKGYVEETQPDFLTVHRVRLTKNSIDELLKLTR